MTMMKSDYCKVCGNPADNHPYRHPFNDGSVPFKTTFAGKNDRPEPPPTPAPSVRVLGANGMPFDPVLRQALVDKGILTPDDLWAAERKIVDASILLTGGIPGGEREGREARLRAQEPPEGVQETP